MIFSTNMIQETWSGRQETREEGTRQGGAPTPLGAPSTLVGPLLLHRHTSSSYIYPHTPPNIQDHHENLIPSPQPSVSARSHLGAFAGASLEGESTTEGLYIISKHYWNQLICHLPALCRLLADGKEALCHQLPKSRRQRKGRRQSSCLP